MSGVNICVSVGGMRDGKEVAGGDVLWTVPPTNVCTTGLRQVAWRQRPDRSESRAETSPERDVTDEPQLPPWQGGGKCHSLTACVHRCHPPPPKPPQSTLWSEMPRWILRAAPPCGATVYKMLQEGMEAQLQAGWRQCLLIL